MATREMTDEEARQEIAIVHAALNNTIQELEGQGMHSPTILEVLIGLAVQIAVEDWGDRSASAASPWNPPAKVLHLLVRPDVSLIVSHPEARSVR